MLERNDQSETGEREASTALRDALRRARAEAAERSDVVLDMRQAEAGRLALLYDALEPVFAEIPYDVDMVSFVEMGRDRRTYRFVRDGRHGRSVAAESAQVQPIVDAVTAYVARRLIERERLLADGDRITELDAEATRPRVAPPAPAASASPAVSHAPAPSAAPAPSKRRGVWIRILTILAAFVVGGAIGAAVVVAMIAAVAKGYLPV